MSIEIRNLTKIYGKQTAVNEASFQINTGEIVGFLGPNGAGKSTTMKILTGYIPQTSGDAEVCGFNVSLNPIDVKRNVGYLPEHNPLYLDTYVAEFLDFAARASNVKERKKRVEEVIELTGLIPERKKKIGQLSKGFRQRVGLAQALIHEPKVLILDEPTSGLDPNQVLEIRKLIADLGKDRTVMLSTHIMQEVEAMCSRVIIINQGNIVADDSTQAISNKIGNTNTSNVTFNKQINIDILRGLAGVSHVVHVTGETYKVSGEKEVTLPEILFKFAVDHNVIILEQKQEKANLETVFQQLTKNV